MEISIRCFYCGENADTIDHVIPRAMLRSLEALDDPDVTAALVNRNRIMEVDCCGDCNSRLGASYSQNLEARRALLKARLRKRYRNLLAMPDWQDSELGSMGPGLMEYILARGKNRDRVRARLAYEGPATRYGVKLR